MPRDAELLSLPIHHATSDDWLGLAITVAVLAAIAIVIRIKWPRGGRD